MKKNALLIGLSSLAILGLVSCGRGNTPSSPSSAASEPSAPSVPSTPSSDPSVPSSDPSVPSSDPSVPTPLTFAEARAAGIAGQGNVGSGTVVTSEVSSYYTANETWDYAYGNNVTKTTLTGEYGYDNYYVLNGEEVTGYRVSNGEVSPGYANSAKIMNGVQNPGLIAGSWDYTYGVLGVLEDIYDFAHDETKIIQNYVEEIDENGLYHFSFEAYVNNYYFNVFDCLFTLGTGDAYVSNLSAYCKQYNSGVNYNEATDLYELAEDAQVYQTIGAIYSQSAGERTATLPFDPSGFYVTAFDIVDAEDNVNPTSISLTTDYSSGAKSFTLTNVAPETANFLFDSFSFEIVEGTAYGVSAYYSSYDNELRFSGSTAGEYVVSYGFKNVKKTMNITVTNAGADSIGAYAYTPSASGWGYDSKEVEDGEISLYVNEEVTFACQVMPYSADQGVTWSIEETSGFEGEAVEFKMSSYAAAKDGYAFKGLSVGDYHLTAVATASPSVSTSFVVHVIEVPNLNSLIDGGYYFLEGYDAEWNKITKYEARFTADKDGEALLGTGTVEIKDNVEEKTEVASYSIDGNDLVLTHVSGDELGFALSVSNYGDVTITVGEDSDQMTRWSIELDIAGDYFYQDTDAGMKYIFNLYWTADYQNFGYSAMSTDYSVYVSSSASGWSAVALDDGTYKIVPSGQSYSADDYGHFGGANRIDDRLGDIIYDPATESISLTICGADGETPVRLTLPRDAD